MTADTQPDRPEQPDGPRRRKSKPSPRRRPGANWQPQPKPPFGWRSRFKDRMARIAKARDKALIPDAQALCRLDAMTDPAALPSNQKQLATDIHTLTSYLLGRTLLRASYANHDRPFTPLAADDEAQRARAVRVERQFRTAMVAAFPPPANATGLPFDIKTFERVFARFVAGELATGTISPVQGDDPLRFDGIPDGANFFSFPESVLLFLRLRLSPEFWQPTLRSFVAGAACFAANYWNGAGRTLNAYATAHFRPDTPSVAMLAMIRQFYGALDLPRLARAFGDIVGTALRDEPRLIHPSPTAPEFL